jgi:hypothetical protein
MQKTGESYTTARAHLLQNHQVLPTEYARLAGMSDATLKRGAAPQARGPGGGHPMKAYWADRLGELGEVLGASA